MLLPLDRTGLARLDVARRTFSAAYCHATKFTTVTTLTISMLRGCVSAAEHLYSCPPLHGNHPPTHHHQSHISGKTANITAMERLTLALPLPLSPPPGPPIPPSCLPRPLSSLSACFTERCDAVMQLCRDAAAPPPPPPSPLSPSPLSHAPPRCRCVVTPSATFPRPEIFCGCWTYLTEES